MIVRTEAVVLRSIEYGETSRIVTLQTRRGGKVAVLARGARTVKSRFGSCLQPMAYIQAVYYHKAGRSLQTLSECSHVRAFHRIARDLEKMTLGLRIVELAGALLEEEDDPDVFDLLVDVLGSLNDADRGAAHLLPYFQLKLAAALGFDPGFERGAVAGLPEEGGFFLLDTGEIRSGGSPVASGMRGSRVALRALAICSRAEVRHALNLALSPNELRELETLVERFFRFHVGAVYPSRSSRVVTQILSDVRNPAS